MQGGIGTLQCLLGELQGAVLALQFLNFTAQKGRGRFQHHRVPRRAEPAGELVRSRTGRGQKSADLGQLILCRTAAPGWLRKLPVRKLRGLLGQQIIAQFGAGGFGLSLLKFPAPDGAGAQQLVCGGEVKGRGGKTADLQ